MTRSEMEELARGAVENHLGDVCDDESSPDSIYESAYTIAVDTLVDAGVERMEAGLVASSIAQNLSQP